MVGLSLSLIPVQVQCLEQRMECKLTLELNQMLEDPVEAAKRLFEESPKVNVPIRIGDFQVNVRAALVSGDDLDSLFENERFAGIVGRFYDETYQLFNRDMRVPEEFSEVMPRLMAFHCLASIRVPSFGDSSGNVRQYQALALELAYAKTLLSEEAYSRFEDWRQRVERSDFFKRDDWKLIVERASARFSEIAAGMARNAQDASDASFRVSHKTEVFMLEGNKALSRKGGGEIPFAKGNPRAPRRLPG